MPEGHHGFRSGRGTSTALMEVNEQVKIAWSEKKKVMIVALDASAAFDLIDRSFIMRSMKVIGAGPKLMKWTGSYLSDRASYVQVGTEQSERARPETGVVQGGPSSPTYYNIGTISLQLWVLIAIIIQYADDNVSVVAANTEAECQAKNQRVADLICQWFDAVGLCLNVEKS